MKQLTYLLLLLLRPLVTECYLAPPSLKVLGASASHRSFDSLKVSKVSRSSRRRLSPSLSRCRGKLEPLRSSRAEVDAVAAIAAIEKKEDGSPSAGEGVVVVGAGPAGLAAAITLLNLGHRVTVYDRLSEPLDPSDEGIWSAEAGGVEKFYLLGIGGRGQVALGKLGIWEEVKEMCNEVVGRKDWSPGSKDGVERVFTDRKYKTQVLPRDKLAGVMYREVVSRYGKGQDPRVKFFFNKEVEVESFGDDRSSAVLRVRSCSSSASSPVGSDDACDVVEDGASVKSSFVVAADGSGRSVAEAMEEQPGGDVKVIRYVDDNVRIYKTIPLKLPPGWRRDLNYSARTGDGRFNFDALPASSEGDYCAVLLLKETDRLAGVTTKEAMREDFDERLPQFSKIIPDEVMERVAAKPPSRLPSFRYVKPRLNRGRVVLLGDCCHSVKPYFGLGANSALEDAAALGEVVEGLANEGKGEGWEVQAGEIYSSKRAREAQSLVKLSRGFDRPGKLGLLSFVGPIILDGVFHGLLPRLFMPNALAMMQATKEDGVSLYGFGEIRRIKRRDRVLQAGFVFVACKAAFKVVRAVLGRKIGKASGAAIAGGYVAKMVFGGGKKKWDNEDFMMDSRRRQRERDGG